MFPRRSNERHLIKMHPDWDNVREDPEFEALVNVTRRTRRCFERADGRELLSRIGACQYPPFLQHVVGRRRNGVGGSSRNTPPIVKQQISTNPDDRIRTVNRRFRLFDRSLYKMLGGRNHAYLGRHCQLMV